MAHTNVRVTELDFDQIKENLKEFLRAQPEFTDYDFDGSNLSVLMDLLAYNTHYNAILANMVSNEMFLDTALKRSSVVSLAKQIGYVPRSITSARATVSVALQNIPGNPNYVTMDRYKSFTTNIDGESYTFYTNKVYTTTPVGGVYTFSDVELYQGRQLEFFYTVNDATPTAKYVIPNLNVDISTLQVAVQYGGTGSYIDTFSRVSDITDVDGSSRVYFLQENTEGYYEVYFGDGVIGDALTVGDVVRLTYLISDGEAANVSTNVSLTWSTNAIAGETSLDRSITTISKPSGGSAGDDLEDIRFYALNNYETQNRAVTENDYAGLISYNLPGAESVNVWGGEKNSPPEYGKTFISIKPKTGYVLTDSEKARIIDEVIKPRCMMTAEHEFVDPNYTYVGFDVTVRYNASRTSLSADQINALVYNKIVTFMNTNLSKFNANFYRSQLEEQIMHSDDSIVSCNILFYLSKRVPAIPGVRVQGVSGFVLPTKIHPNEIRSSYFYYTDSKGYHTAQVIDVPDQSPPDYEGTGTLKTIDLNTGEILDNNLGIIDYGTGVITLNAASPLTVSGYLGNTTQFYYYVGVQESVGDIFPAFNEILVIDDSSADTVANVRNGITINIVPVVN